MKDRIPHMVKIFEAHNAKDLTALILQFEKLTDALFRLTQSLFDAKTQMPYHQLELENKYFRFGIANHSIINLIKGNQFLLLKQKIDIRDVFSLFSLTRMQIETFIIMFYLFFNGEPSDLAFRYNIYKLHGLRRQSKFSVNSEYAKSKLTEINTEIDELVLQIKKSEQFIKSSSKEQKEYLNPRFAKLVKTDLIMEESGLKERRFDEMWSLYSNHAHSEHISDRQFNAIYKKKKSTIDEASSTITLNSILTAKLCLHLKNNFGCAQDEYNSLDIESQVLIDTWSSLKK